MPVHPLLSVCLGNLPDILMVFSLAWICRSFWSTGSLLQRERICRPSLPGCPAVLDMRLSHAIRFTRTSSSCEPAFHMCLVVPRHISMMLNIGKVRIYGKAPLGDVVRSPFRAGGGVFNGCLYLRRRQPKCSCRVPKHLVSAARNRSFSQQARYSYCVRWRVALLMLQSEEQVEHECGY